MNTCGDLVIYCFEHMLHSQMGGSNLIKVWSLPKHGVCSLCLVFNYEIWLSKPHLPATTQGSQICALEGCR